MDHVICSKLKMFQSPGVIPGYTNILPNFRARTSPTGIAMPALSPMLLGPVIHGQPNLPESQNLENFHQFNKVFPLEVDGQGNPLPVFFERQLAGYIDKKPHRHKFRSKVPLYSVIRHPSGELRKYGYLDSRYFYCLHYERLVREKSELVNLRSMLSDGVKLHIVGYDGYVIPWSPSQDPAATLYKCYLDTSKPFGHELVLCSLLTIKNPSDYPWNRYFTEHISIYE